MKEYDSILKEEKQYADPAPIKHSKYTKYIIIDIIAIILILIVSYIVYYHTILNGKQIFLEDMNRLFEQYHVFLKHFPIEKYNSNYAIEGTIKLQEANYNYGIIRNKDNLKISFSDSKEHLDMFKKDNQLYIKAPSIKENYILYQKEIYVNLAQELAKNFTTYITDDQYIKTFYLEGKKPIVEVNMQLKKDNLATILGNTNSLPEDLEVLITLKNNAITNQTISMKAVVRTSNTRVVWNYQDGVISYTDNEGIMTKFVLIKKNKDFNLKIYKNDSLYSVLSGTAKAQNYEYVYQIIDKIYTLRLDIRQKKAVTTYTFSSNIENDGVTTKQELILTNQDQDEIILEENTKDAIIYSKLTEEEQNQYQNLSNQLINPLREFIQKYQ